VSAGPEVPPLVRIHSECFTGDVLRSERCDCRPQLLEAVRRIAQVGALPLYLRQEDRGIGLYANLDAYGLQDAGLDTYDANLALGYSEDGRDYTVAAQMLGALGLDRVALLSNNPDKAAQLDRLGVTVAERVPTAVHLNATNARYLATKAGRGARWSSLAMTCSTPRRRARTARRLLSCHLGRTSRSWWCTVTDRWPAAASARRRLAYDGAWARSSGRCSHAPASQPVNHAAARAA
jgi:GTP cyclohydrolase II